MLMARSVLSMLMIIVLVVCGQAEAAAPAQDGLSYASDAACLVAAAEATHPFFVLETERIPEYTLAKTRYLDAVHRISARTPFTLKHKNTWSV